MKAKKNSQAIKSPQNSTAEKKERSNNAYIEYYSMLTYKRTPIKEAAIRLLSEEYIAWAFNNNEALILDDYPRLKGIPLDTWDRWKRDFEFLKAAHAEAKRAIGARREKLAFWNRANANIFMTSAPHYDYNAPDMSWKELLEAKAALNEASSAKSAIYLVEDEAKKKTPEQVASEIHQKTKKYVKPKYDVKPESVDNDDEE